MRTHAGCRAATTRATTWASVRGVHSALRDGFDTLSRKPVDRTPRPAPESASHRSAHRWAGVQHDMTLDLTEMSCSCEMYTHLHRRLITAATSKSRGGEGRLRPAARRKWTLSPMPGGHPSHGPPRTPRQGVVKRHPDQTGRRAAHCVRAGPARTSINVFSQHHGPITQGRHTNTHSLYTFSTLGAHGIL